MIEIGPESAQVDDAVAGAEAAVDGGAEGADEAVGLESICVEVREKSTCGNEVIRGVVNTSVTGAAG